MKRILCLLMVLCLMLPVAAMAEGATVKIGQAYFGAHNNGVTVATVVLVDGVIVDALIDEVYATAPNDAYVALPNLGNVAEGAAIMISKRENNAVYSENMMARAATQELATSYDAIQAFVIGKTVAELEEAVSAYTADNKAEFVDVVSGSTLTDTLNYTLALLEAARNAQ